MSEKNSSSGVSGTGPHKTVVRSELIEAFDRLVKPLDQILVQMRLHAERQRLLVITSIVIVAVMLLATWFQIRLYARMTEVERHIVEVTGVANATNAKVTAAERKIDEVKSAAAVLPHEAPPQEARSSKPPSGH